MDIDDVYNDENLDREFDEMMEEGCDGCWERQKEVNQLRSRVEDMQKKWDEDVMALRSANARVKELEGLLAFIEQREPDSYAYAERDYYKTLKGG